MSFYRNGIYLTQIVGSGKPGLASDILAQTAYVIGFPPSRCILDQSQQVYTSSSCYQVIDVNKDTQTSHYRSILHNCILICCNLFHLVSSPEQAVVEVKDDRSMAVQREPEEKTKLGSARWAQRYDLFRLYHRLPRPSDTVCDTVGPRCLHCQYVLCKLRLVSFWYCIIFGVWELYDIRNNGRI